MDELENPQFMNGSLPPWLRWIMIFINRVGFPILAFLLMFYLCTVTINRNTETLVKMNLNLENIDHKLNSSERAQ